MARPIDEERIFAAYGRAHARDLRLRRAACRMVKTIVATPPMARHVAARLSRFPERAHAIFAPVSGVAAIERAFDLVR